MKYWARKVVKPYCEDFGYKSLCEIGASLGGATDIVLGMTGVQLAVIDPCLDADLCGKYSREKRLTVYKGLSLAIIPELAKSFDCILIDGDHNWYTVYNELRAIEEKQLLNKGATIFLHDVGWPYGRRDMYYQPDTIPIAFRNAHSKKGIVYGRSELSATEGENRDFYNAEVEGGVGNGVLTAIEDFIRERGSKYVLFCFKDECGLGVLAKMDGIKSRRVLAKWRLLCALHNIFGLQKNIIKYRFPHLCRIIKKTGTKD